GQVVDPLLELFADLEMDRLLRPDIDRLARLGVAAFVRLVILDREAPETADLDPLLAQDGVRHAVDDAVDDLFCALLRQLTSLCKELDELGLCHHAPFFRAVW